ncbi:sulfatase [Stakelama sp. CBK3Z-3]|uniref:Sulfatase n=2 Tax=Stakelama flava TaxID=2860338 RepID=A0ABS6XNN5_9SPHN|nr:sulfatase [Stakelama flava]
MPVAQARRPNILFIMSDDHALQALSAYGSPISRLAPTPNLDRIAHNGALFENSFVTNSLCGPSRAAMLTGKFGNKNGFNQNGDQFDNYQPTWPRALKDAGYQTAIVGKWHIGHDPKGMKFDYWKVLRDQGEYYNPDFITPDGEVREHGYATDLITDMGIDWLDHRDPDKPFVLMVHHKAPHRNWMPAPRHLTKYLNTKFPVPDNFFDDYEGRDAAAIQAMNVHRNMYEGHDLKMTTGVGSSKLRYNRWPGAFDRMTPDQRKAFMDALQQSNDAMNAKEMTQREMALWKYQRYLQQYLATIVSVDESVGRLLDYLDTHGLTDNTIVVYTSDQGFYLGEHGWFDKRFMYEESFRTPLLIQYPGHIKPGTKIDSLVQNIDYAPTFMDYAGLQVPDAVQGRSLRPLLEGKKPADWRKSLYYHYYEYPAFHRVTPHCGVRDQRYKLIHFYGPIESWELFDEQSDREEMHNLIDDPAQVTRVVAMKRELLRLQAKYGDQSCG